MLYAGVDYHKRYSQVHVVDERGGTRATARLANDFGTLKGFFATLTEPCRAVVEAGWNWGVMYDWLDTIDNVSAVELAHPYRVRAIVAAQVKTDSIDSHTLAQRAFAAIPSSRIFTHSCVRAGNILRIK
jgi:transposase